MGGDDEQVDDALRLSEYMNKGNKKVQINFNFFPNILIRFK